MDSFVVFMQGIIDFMKREYIFYGFEFSFYDVFMFTILMSLIGFVLSVLLDRLS